MKNKKSHFVFSKSEQNGIVILIILIVVLQLCYFFIDFSPRSSLSSEDGQRLEKFQKVIDSIKQNQVTKKDSIKIFPFNPNYVTDFKGYMLGMNTTEIDRLIAYRKQGKFVNSAAEFQQVTKISDSLLMKISPFFKFPTWVKNEQSRNSMEASKNSKMSKFDLNFTSLEQLKELKGIGDVLAARIINYRNKIGGFRDLIQLKDIYGLSFELRDIIASKFVVVSPENSVKLNINTASVIQLSEIPYFGYELAREIINYRSLHEGISSFEELAQIKDFPSEKIDRIALYLTLE